VVVIDDTVMIAVNARPVLYTRLPLIDRAAGYVSIHAGLLPMSVTDVHISEISQPPFPADIQAVGSAPSVRVAVERNLSTSQAVAALPAKVNVEDTAGKTHSVDVQWTAQNGFDGTAAGSTTRFVGELKNLPSGLVNALGVTVNADVFVKAVLDFSDLNALLATARALSEANFTVESWAALVNNVGAAEDVLTDPFMLQNAVGVVVWQLDVAIRGLVSTLDRSALTAAIAKADAADLSDYTAYTAQAYTAALAAAKTVCDDNLSTRARLDEVLAALNAAEAGLTLQVDDNPIGPPPTPKPPARKGCGKAASAIVGLAGLAVIAVVKKKRSH
jgi:hypothetical protein